MKKNVLHKVINWVKSLRIAGRLHRDTTICFAPFPVVLYDNKVFVFGIAFLRFQMLIEVSKV